MNPSSELLLLSVAVATFLTSNALQLHPAGDAAGASCIPHERHALLAFKHGISSDPMDLLASWQKDGQQGDCCRWRGIRCSNRTGHVLKLQLQNVQASMNTALVGQISHSLLSLDHLIHLDLSMNNLSGGSSSHIPEFLSSLVNLRYLNLSGIPFSGRVPPHLGNLSKLQFLDVSDGDHMYSTDLSWLAGLSKLEYLSMNKVNLSTIVDWPYVLNMIPSLRALSLSDCSLLNANKSFPHSNLTNLISLDLSGNNFFKPVASSWFSNMTGLQHLNLTGNNLDGMMTTSFKRLCNLIVVDFSWCYLYGSLKELIQWIPQCSLSKLKELHLRKNNITGSLPSEMAHMTSLVVLDISDNHLTGAIPPWMGQIASLSTLDVSGNNLSGHVPSEIGFLANLTVLDLRSNRLNGCITEKHFTRLSKLKGLYLYRNSLKINVSSEWLPPFSLEVADLAHCKIGPLFPSWFRSQVNILWVDISNTSLIAKLPDWFSTTFSKATYLDISLNKINGRLPKNMEFMSLEYFYLTSNELTGQIPCLPRNLSRLDLSQNYLSGNLPSKFGTPRLTSLDLFNNHITGDLFGSICDLKSLIGLDLGNNFFEGGLPQCFPVKALRFLMLDNNSFSGNFPPFLESCMQLEFLDLARNKFDGKLPRWIGDLVGLRFLRLSQNIFSGNIPTSIANLSHLHHLDLANNSFSGAIPRHLSSLTAMTGKYVKDPYIDEYPYGGYVYLSGETRDCFTVVTKGRKLYYDIRIIEMVNIDLSFNHLSGGIPGELASLDALRNLNISWNNLSGEVPNNIGVMKSLESLDLSNNVLSGEIPSSLSNLSYLSYLDLSDNNLTGRIPPGQQLDTLYSEYPYIYSGNNGLCGPPLPNICSRNNASRQDVQNRNEHGFEPMSFYFGLGLGFMTGLWAVFCIVLFKKSWSVAYFRLIDNIYDQMSVLVVGYMWNRLEREGSTY